MAISDSDPLVQLYLRSSNGNYKDFYIHLNGECMTSMLEVLDFLQSRHGFFPSWDLQGPKVAGAGVSVPRMKAAIMSIYWKGQISFYEFITLADLPSLLPNSDQIDEIKVFFPHMYPDGSHYSSERGVPSVERCGNFSLLFDGYYLKFQVGYDTDSAWHARSGLSSGQNFDYTEERQKWSDVGPIPKGEYWVQNFQITSPKMPFSYRSWGNHRLTIHQIPNTVTYGRGGFFIHGGSVFGSKGCIDLAYGMDSFVAKMREKVPAESDKHCYLPLTVRYATTKVGFP
jgi:hypothetical protein